MKKIRILSVVLAIMMVMTMTTFVNAKSFDDVTAESHSWAVEAIESMADLGIITGYTDGTFKPDNVVTKLESLLLAARILGVNAPENEALLDAAIEAYGEKVEDYELNFGSDEVCYLLIKNVISEEELADYIGKSNVSQGMKRYEIAVLLTKALDAEDEVSKNLITSLEFADADDIPAYAKKYVEYVTKNGLMNGVGDNQFSPNTDVTRAQIAVLMNKLSEKTKYTYFYGKVAEMDYSTKVIRVKNEEDSARYIVNADAILRFEGADITVNDIATGYDAVITVKDGSLYAIDFITPLVEKEVKGVVTAKTSGTKPTLTFYVVGDEDVVLNTNTKETYPLSSSAVYTYEGGSASINEVAIGSFVDVSIKEGQIVSVDAYAKTKTLTGIVSSVEITPVCKLNVSLNDGGDISYILASDVEVTKNGKKVTAAEVVAGDTVSVTAVYERITKIIATSKTTEKSGVIKEVIISATPRITVKNDEGEITYPISNACKLAITGKAAPTFYDLRVGVAVKLTLEGETVVELVTDASEGVTQINGTVTSVNVSYGVIQINYIDPSSGTSVTEPVFVKTKATIIDILTGNALKLNTINVGAKITAFGVRNSGIFEATTINVSN